VVVGILALQGDVREHEASFDRLGAHTRRLLRPEDLEGVEAVVLPGGESTTISMLLSSSGLRGPLESWVREDRPTLGTCAGMVLLASEVIDGREDQVGLGGLGICVRRNGWGRQRFSFEAKVEADALGGPFEGIFIRAPRIVAIDEGTEVLGTLEGEAVLVERGRLLGCAFHPELAGDDRLHARLLSLI
jgi:5'-phosphate synthase pdxT subunit